MRFAYHEKHKRMLLTVFCTALLACCFCLSPSVAAAVERSEVPDAGKSIHNLEQKKMAPPAKKSVKVVVEAPSPPAPKDDNQMKIRVRSFHITGQNVFSEKRLQALVKDAVGQELTFSRLQAQTDKITDFFRSKGYLVAKAYLPPQKITGGVVEIAVVVGKYDQIIIHNKTSVADKLLKRKLGSLRSGAYIKKKSLERSVWLLGDLAGVDAKVTLSPGRTAGTSNLTIDLETPRSTHANISIDNYGSRYTGSWQAGMSYTLDNPLRQGDALAMRYTRTNGHMNGGSAYYQLPAFGQGHSLGLGYSRVYYLLGEEFESTNSYGTADVLKLSWNYAFQRSQTKNLYGQFSLESGLLKDYTNGADVAAKTRKAATFSLNGDSQDSRGVTSYQLSYKIGNLSMDSEAAQALDSLSTQSAGHYGKWNIAFLRQQYLNSRTVLLLSANGQWADKNLDSSEKISLGGANGVRAYPQGEASGDQGVMATAELRWSLPLKKGASETFQLAAFVDYGSVLLNKNPWTTGVNQRTLSGAGLGFIWGKPNDATLRVNYSWKLSNEPTLSDTNQGGRLWVQFSKSF